MPSDNVVLIGSLDMYSKRNDTPTVVQHDGETHVSYPPIRGAPSGLRTSTKGFPGSPQCGKSLEVPVKACDVTCCLFFQSLVLPLVVVSTHWWWLVLGSHAAGHGATSMGLMAV